nr:cholinephosphotransferase 1-like [Leptinotarsa decemlineata]
MTLFYCAHWQTYVSGTLRFGKIDVTEAQFTIMVILLVSTIFGPSVWSKTFFSESFQLWYLIPMGTLACGFITLNNSLTIVFTGGVGKNGSTVAVSLVYLDEYFPGLVMADDSVSLHILNYTKTSDSQNCFITLFSSQFMMLIDFLCGKNVVINADKLNLIIQ